MICVISGLDFKNHFRKKQRSMWKDQIVFMLDSKYKNMIFQISGLWYSF
jgi:hypothetical protein